MSISTPIARAGSRACDRLNPRQSEKPLVIECSQRADSTVIKAARRRVVDLRPSKYMIFRSSDTTESHVASPANG